MRDAAVGPRQVRALVVTLPTTASSMQHLLIAGGMILSIYLSSSQQHAMHGSMLLLLWYSTALSLYAYSSPNRNKADLEKKKLILFYLDLACSQSKMHSATVWIAVEAAGCWWKKELLWLSAPRGWNLLEVESYALEDPILNIKSPLF